MDGDRLVRRYRSVPDPRGLLPWLVGVVLILGMADVSRAQDTEDDAALKVAEPDFTVITLPTSLRLPQFGSACCGTACHPKLQ
jgi:hypothetical protein